MSTKIFYNNQDLSQSGIQPTPFVGKTDSFIKYPEQWGIRSTFELNGQLTGCQFADLINAQNNLINIFNKDFQSFQIIEDGNLIVDKPYSIIKGGISFKGSAYNYILDYSISLDCYDQNLFSGTFGVLEPNDEWKFEETEDSLINITHTISARGFNTSSGNTNAFDNAKNFVINRTGLNNFPTPFLTYSGTFSPCLKSLSEKIDRFNTSYGVNETYVFDKYFGLDGILRYTSSLTCNTEGISRVDIQGTVDGCGMYADISSIRTRYSGLNIFSLANEIYTGNSSGNLNPYYLSSGVSEDIYNKKLNFNISFDNSTGLQTFLIYDVNIVSGDNGITNVSFNGQIKGRGNLKEKWQNVQEFYSGLVPYDYASSYYNDFSDNTYPLNSEPSSSGVTFNQFNGEIDVNVSWDNETLIPGFSDLNYTLNYTPSLQKVTFSSLTNDCNLEYYVTDLGFANRAGFSIEGNGKVSCLSNIPEAIISIKQLANQIFGSQCPKTRAVLEENNIGTGNYYVNFRFGWTADSNNRVSNDYVTVNNLSLV